MSLRHRGDVPLREERLMSPIRPERRHASPWSRKRSVETKRRKRRAGLLTRDQPLGVVMAEWLCGQVFAYLMSTVETLSKRVVGACHGLLEIVTHASSLIH